MAQSDEEGLLDRIANMSFGSFVFNPVVLMVMLMTAVVFVAIGVWNQYHQRMNLPVNCKLNASMINISPQPDWVKYDIKKAAILESGLLEIELENPDAIQHVANALAIQSWVESVNSVRKLPQRIDVSLNYRKPVAMVEEGESNLVLIDANAVVLDGRGYTASDIKHLWRVSVADRVVVEPLSHGRIWNDLRIAGAALIAETWKAADHNRWGLVRIDNQSPPTRDPLRLRWFALRTKNNTTIIWGNAPGAEIPGEASAQEKILAIKSFVDENGPLDQQSTQIFDVRSGQLREATPETANKNADFIRLK